MPSDPVRLVENHGMPTELSKAISQLETCSQLEMGVTRPAKRLDAGPHAIFRISEF